MRKGWENINFVNCIDKVPKQKQVKSKDYKQSGKYPIVSQEKELISGYWDDDSYLYRHHKPIIIFGDHTKEVKFIDFDFVVGADGTQILCPKDNIDSKFFYYALKATKLRNLGYARHFKLLKEKTFGIPSLPEQQRIVSYLDAQFAKIDQLKANAEKQLQAAKDLFQSALKELLTPKDGWKMKTIDSLQTEMYRGSGITREQIRLEGVPCVRYGEIYTTYNYWFEECVSHTDEQIINSKKYFEYGDILFAITGESVEDIGKSIAYLGHNRCLAGGDIIVMKHSQNPKYLAYALSTPDAIAQKGLGKTKLKVVHTNAPSLKAIVLPIPTLKEQQQIANKLDAISAKIKALQTNYTETITLCNDLKQSLLKQIFE